MRGAGVTGERGILQRSGRRRRAGAGSEVEPVAAQEPSFGPTLPYSVELGRGGGRSGLETIRVEPDGAVTLHRNPSRRGDVGWERATLALSEPQRAELTESLGRHRVLTLDGRYSAGIADGTRWVLRIVHGEEEHVV